MDDLGSLTPMEQNIYAVAFSTALRQFFAEATAGTRKAVQKGADEAGRAAVLVYRSMQPSAAPMQVKQVKQDKFGQCGAACLAMVLKCELSAVVQGLERDNRRLVETGMSDVEMCAYLRAQDVDCYITMEREPDQPAILTVPSLNHSGVLHYVYWDGAEYHDPSRGPKTYPDDAPTLGSTKMVCWTTAIVIGKPPRKSYHYCGRCEQVVQVHAYGAVSGDCTICAEHCDVNTFDDSVIEALFYRWRYEGAELPSHSIGLLFTKIEVLESALAECGQASTTPERTQSSW